MSNTTPTPPRDAEAADASHFTVEDGGSTTNPADLSHDAAAGTSPVSGTAHGSGAAVAVSSGSDRSVAAPSASTVDPASAPDAPAAPSAPEAPDGGRAALVDDYSIGHVFDQTNGVIEGVEGDSDGTAESDGLSGAERSTENPAFETFADSAARDGGGTDDSRHTGS
jgi:hypothetical protein